MAAPTFLQVLTAEVARMRAAHPEREGELARAHTLILHGMVLPSPTDVDTGQVLSSDAQTTYSVNGTCSCPAGQHGKGCKHVQAWKLYQHIARKVAAQTAQDAPAAVPASGEGETSGTSNAPTGLPEAPASVNCHLTISGRQVQLTLRDSDEARLLQRLAAVLQQYPVPQPAPQAPTQGEGWCSTHGVPMTQSHKDGRSWWSHRLENGSWCKGR